MKVDSTGCNIDKHPPPKPPRPSIVVLREDKIRVPSQPPPLSECCSGIYYSAWAEYALMGLMVPIWLMFSPVIILGWLASKCINKWG